MKAEFGITRKCIFDYLDYVKVVELISPDVVHDFMEGVVLAVICISLLNVMMFWYLISVYCILSSFPGI